MNAMIQKWGNSLALRIPMSFAKSIHIHQGSAVDVILGKDKIEIHPKNQAKKKYVLSEMIKRITKDNIHHEIDWSNYGRELI